MNEPLIESENHQRDNVEVSRSRAYTPKITHLKSWEFAGWGDHQNRKVSTDKLQSYKGKSYAVLDEWSATAICGNDILSSCLYVSGLTAVSAGYLAPVCLVLVAVVLSFYRRIYGEVITALPKNGGVFNALIHTTSKGTAAFASCLSLLSYIATGVVSASTAIHYLIVLIETVTGHESNIPEITATILLLLVFALLCFCGLKESSVVALGIFIAHTFCLLLLMAYCFMYAFNDNWSTLVTNWGHELPTVTIDGADYRNAAASIFMGYATALLGVSGFESSSQFVEEQKPGVFRKTLRNMWYAVAFFNPVISFLSFAVMPYTTEGDRVGILDAKSTLLSEMAFVTAGHWLKVVMSIDAFVVLCGAVLTGYVGVNGLIRRIASDRCLPQILLSENKWRGTNHYIIFGFFLFSSSLLIVLKGDESTLAGVYTYAFLGVMNILGWSCVILKVKRPEIPREETAPFWAIAFGIIGTGIGLLGNILGKPEVLQNFVLYFLGIGLVMFSMYNRIRILKLLSKAIPSLANCFTSVIEQIHNQNIVFFTKHADLAVMAKAVMYVRENEQTSQMTFVHIRSTTNMKSGDSGEDGNGFTNDIFSDRVNLLDKMFPKIKLSSIVIEGGEFDVPTIHYISDVLKIPQNFMFMASPSNFGLQKVGGLRIITS